MHHTDPTNARAYTRRQFVATSLTLASSSLFVPRFLQSAAGALPHAAMGMTSIPGVPEDRVLVVIQLGGGNDGLNTVVPYAWDEYYRARPTIAIPQNQVLTLNDGAGLHPRMAALKDLYDSGNMAVVQGVGYPNPNRSHFTSMDIWHTADTSATGEGWLGRYFDSACCGYGAGESGAAPNDPNPQAGVAIGRTAPLAMEGRKIKPIAFETADLFRWTGQDIHPDLMEPYKHLNEREQSSAPAESNASFLTRTALDAQVSSSLIRKAVSMPPLERYPNSNLARQLSMVSSMIRAGLPTRVYYVSHGGFDTHAQQGGANGQHANLLGQFADAVGAFYRDLARQENNGRVLTMAFSEFGRRVGQNASGGTDHGTAAPLYLFGPMVEPGMHGQHPSLRDLDQGDLKFTVDFRRVYASVLDTWLKADVKDILGRNYRPLDVLRERV